MLDKLITEKNLENLAGETAFQRGEAYFSVGSVGPLRDTGDKISARVEGTETYRVELWDDDGSLGYDCTCPRAAEGYFCKHCVALGLAWLSGRKESGGAVSAKEQRRDPWRDIRDYLNTQTPEVLVELLLDTAERDDRLYQSLLFKAERAVAGTDVVNVFRKAIDQATRIHGFIDWRESGDFASNLDQVVELLEELLAPDSAELLIELAEYAIKRLEDSLEQIDDSNGEVGDIVATLGDLHLRACELAKPEPQALAERLFHLEMKPSFEICSFDASTYRDALGEEGVQRYRELAEAEWAKIKPRHSNDAYDSRRSRLTYLMESLARESGDVEELVAIKSRDLSLPYHYLAIAEIWTKAGQDDKALDWAERGLQAFPNAKDNRLRDFLVAAYLQRQRNDEALQLTWVQFEERASLEQYKKLHSVAGQLGVWPEQRQRALARVAEVITDQAAFTTRWKPKPSIPDYSLRAEIALWENDLDAAWTALHAGNCNQGLMIALAGKLESTRPNDALILYKRIIPSIVDQTNNVAYADAAKLIRKVGEIMNAQKRNREFGDYLAELRVRFKPKRNFIKLLNEMSY
ncbi:SWIM zinc finger family protein [Methylobacter svalbardensis]|uniref:SWIM zinc finger family protein n=1 Tax=Methylobacter svalbardensis TaxID=3080016 RepID=UPI0030EE89A9